MGVVKEFMEFLKEYKVLALAVAFIIGAAAKDLVSSLADNIIMPFITPLIPGGNWRTSTLALGSIELGIGPFIAALVDFIIIAFIVFMIAKKVMKEEKVTKK